MLFIKISEVKRTVLFCLFVFTTTLAFAQVKTTIKGIVKGPDGPIKGATITVKNTFKEAVTNKEGAFSIKVTQDDSVLEIKSFAMEYKEVSINRNGPMQINLEFDGQLLDEVLLKAKAKKEEVLVETGFGKENRNKIGYSTSQVLTEEDIKNTDISMFDVIRKMPGVQIFGLPPRQSLIFVKNRSITTAAPGVSIDGAVFDQNILNTLDPKQVASVRLLKSINSTIKYGQLGAGGMILITTKLGKGNELTAEEKVASLLAKGNEYEERVLLLETVSYKPAYVVELEKATTFEEAKSIFNTQKQKEANYTIPFYTETSDYFLRWDKAYSFEVLATIAKLAANNPKALKAYAFKLEERGEFKKVVSIYNRILALRPDSAQAYRDLALACEAAGDYETAFSLLYQIVFDKIPNVDCSGIQDLAYNEFRHLLAFHKAKVPYQNLPNEMLSLDYKKDIRIVFDWTQPAVDFDIQFVSPEGKFFNWSHTKFDNKELFKQEIAQGFALKEHIIDDGEKGKWLVNIQYMEHEKPKNPVYLKYTVFQDYGLPTETKTVKIIPMYVLEEKRTIDTILN